MFWKSVLIIAIILTGSLLANAQGGKAEPKRIEFPAGKSSIVLTGSLSNGSEMEYVFEARKGQKVTIKNTRPGQFDFRVFNEDAGFETEFESSAGLTFEIPESGDYLLFVRKKMVSRPRTARYSISLGIK